MAATSPLKLGGISLGGDQTTRMRRTMVFEWSDDDDVPVAPPPSMKAPPRSTRARRNSRWEGRKFPQQWVMEVPEQQARGASKRQAEEVPEQQARGALERWAEERPIAEIVGYPPQDAGVGTKAAAGGSGRHR